MNELCNFMAHLMLLPMKYLKMTAFLLVVGGIYFFYLFIPNRIIISGNDYFPKAANDPDKGILQIQYWDKWMPYKKIEGHSFVFENCKLDVQEAFISSAKSNISRDDTNAPLIISALDAGNDSTYVRYECSIDNRSFSPIVRWHNYASSKKMEEQILKIMKAAKIYYSKPAINK
jgi:hypothetical protein